MNFQRRWVRRDLPTNITKKPIEPYAESDTLIVNEGQDLDIDLEQYVRSGPVQVESKPYWLEKDGTHLKGTVPLGTHGKSYKVIIEDIGGRK